ncbi:uncharacterized protein LOC110900826 [Helianthus annuus]|uniref:uncharacterized protein LOC110900826 n=1 Tax=Helianthus annuus TaxID=4232 RepID=UPI000B8FC676|nr:uncharacterized protein LOC110900826 [Helianthus annuus]
MPLKDLFPNLFRLEVVKNCSIRDRVEGLWLWKHDPATNDKTRELAILSDALISVLLNNRSDVWKWMGDPSGRFSVRSVKNVLRGNVDVSNRYVMDWCKWTPIKCNVFAWRAEINRIPTYDALLRRGIVVGDGLCFLCKAENESVDHLFVSCKVVAVIWQRVSRWGRIPNISAFSFKDLLETHKYVNVGETKKKAVQGIIIMASWYLWKARNKSVFSAANVKAEDVFYDIRSMGFLCFKFRSKNNPISLEDWCKFVIM